MTTRGSSDRNASPAAGEPEFPPELARCTCGTPSHCEADHDYGCRLGEYPPLSSAPARGKTDRRYPGVPYFG